MEYSFVQGAALVAAVKVAERKFSFSAWPLPVRSMETIPMQEVLEEDTSEVVREEGWKEYRQCVVVRFPRRDRRVNVVFLGNKFHPSDRHIQWTMDFVRVYEQGQLIGTYTASQISVM